MVDKAMAPVCEGAPWRRSVAEAMARPRTVARAVFVVFAVAIVAFVARATIGPHIGAAATTVLALLGMTTCGWSWLLARALFHRTPFATPWPLVVVAVLALSGMGLYALNALAPALADQSGWRVVANIHALTSSAVLFLAFVETFDHYRDYPEPRERRFRLVFAGSYTILLLVSVVWVSGAPEGTLAAQWADRIRVTCAVLAVVAGALALRFREAHPLPERARTASRARVATAEDTALAARLKQVLIDEELYTTPDLTVLALSKRLGAPDYKVTRAVTGPLGYANLNRLLNHHRVERAKTLLREPARRDDTILAIALDSGFGSVGPFNRAFKEATGVTPSAFRTGVEAS